MDNKTDVIVLAAGRGTRMKSELPKVMVPFKGTPLIDRVLFAVSSSGVSEKPIVVVGYKKEVVQEHLGDSVEYVFQEKQLGTGHAVAAAKGVSKAATVVVLYGDHPYLKGSSIETLVNVHTQSNSKLTMMTTSVPHFDEEFRAYRSLSRIVRDEQGHIIKDVQVKDATDNELLITEINPCYFCFDAAWLWSHLPKLQNTNAQREFYLTDLIAMAIEEGVPIGSISIEPMEALGINSKEDLERMEV